MAQNAALGVQVAGPGTVHEDIDRRRWDGGAGREVLSAVGMGAMDFTDDGFGFLVHG